MIAFNDSKKKMIAEMTNFVETIAATKKVTLSKDAKKFMVDTLLCDYITGISESRIAIKAKSLIKVYKITVGA